MQSWQHLRPQQSHQLRLHIAKLIRNSQADHPLPCESRPKTLLQKRHLLAFHHHHHVRPLQQVDTDHALRVRRRTRGTHGHAVQPRENRLRSWTAKAIARAHKKDFAHALTPCYRLDWNWRGIALPTLAPMRPVAKRTLRAQTTPAKRNRRLIRQIPLVPRRIHQLDWPLNSKRPIGPNCNLHRRHNSRCCNFIRHLFSPDYQPQHSKDAFQPWRLPRSRCSDHRFIHVTPPPALARLDTPHHGMPGLVEVLRRMFSLARIAAPHMPAHQALAQVNPLHPQLQTFNASGP
jgi:hypothetical protein